VIDPDDQRFRALDLSPAMRAFACPSRFRAKHDLTDGRFTRGVVRCFRRCTAFEDITDAIVPGNMMVARPP
jgi:hypothetical protein